MRKRFKFKQWNTKHWFYAGATCLAIALIAGLLVNSGSHDFSALTDWLLNEDTSLTLFIILLATLPVIGFPISLFCILAGARFGVAGGLMVIGFAMAWHLLVSYLMAHSFLKERVKKMLSNIDYQIPEVKKHHQLGYAVAFVAVPVIPYAAKNILLALSDLPWRIYFLVAWSIQMIYSYPLVAIVGAAKEQSIFLLATGLLGLLVIFVLARWARKTARADESG